MSRNELDLYQERITVTERTTGYGALEVTSLLKHSTAQQSRKETRGKIA